MNKYIILFILLASYFNMNAQGNISYILPDIGGPGMNIYMEIIGPDNSKGNFGQDGMYVDGEDVDGLSTDIVEFNLHPNDIGKVVFGPAIVSWDGRMISTQVFVNPNLNPNSWDWNELDNEFRIRFNVLVNGMTPIEYHSFYIVQPFPMGDVSSLNEYVFGEGNLGKRSPRGAMLIDYAVLGNGTYTVNTDDTDDNKGGNQGYLPFLLLSKGPITGSGNTRISLDADDYDLLEDAAPGGGGGGGRFCDEVSGQNGSSGGSGFTGGGPGGYNRYVESGNIGGWKDPGIGSGSTDGYSINGVQPGVSYVGSAAESAGGGTGHPFGTSGAGASYNTDNDRVGGYGAGSGFRRDWAGGGAGYGTDAEQYDVHQFYGRSHGNKMVVPIAGGSGGASGNPQAGFVPGTYCSGSGGAGGGAIQIFAPEIENIDLSAVGAQGGAGHNNSNGGSGSGGYIGIFTKTYANSIDVDISGNQRGSSSGTSGKSGEGRVRFDVQNTSSLTPEEFLNNGFAGHTTDTTYYVKRNDVITGTKKQTETVYIYLKSFNSDWDLIGTHTSGNTNWQQNLDLQDDDIYFLFAVQSIPNNNNGDYDAEPDYVLSQAAANVLMILKDPDINGDTLLYASTINCEGISVDIPFKIWNEGEGPLELNLQNALFHSNKGFSLKSPTGLETIAGTPLGETDYDTLDILASIRYFPGTYEQPLTGIIRDTLSIPNNDPDENPWEVAFEVEIKEFNVSSHILEEDPFFENPIDSLYLGKICRGDATSRDFLLLNRSPFQISVNPPAFRHKNGFDAILNFTMPLDSDDASIVTVFYDDISTTEDIMFDVISITTSDCPGKVVDSIYVWVEIVDASIESISPTSFEDTRVGATSTENVIFENTGTADLLLESLADISVNPPYYATGTIPPVPTVLKPGEQLTVIVDFIPADTLNNPKIRFLEIQFAASDTTCTATVAHELSGNAIQSDLEISKTVMDFGTVRHCENPSDTVMISNAGNFRIEIKEQAFIEGPDSDDFLITSAPKNPPIVITDANSGGVKYFVQFNPQSPGTKEAELVIITDDEENPEIRIRLIGTLEPFNVFATQIPFNLGDVPVGFDVPFAVTMRNAGYFEEFFVEIINPSGANYIMDDNTNNSLIPSNSNISITGTLNLKQGGNYTEQLIAVFEYPVEDGVCYDTVQIDIRANGLTATMDITGEIDFGIIPPCGNAIDLIEFSHRRPPSNAPYVILSESLTDNNSNLFYITGSGLNFPDTLDAENNAFGAEIFFDPQGAEDGIYTCNYYAEYYINAQFKDTLISVRAEVRSAEFTFVDNPLDFGSVIIGTPAVQDIFTLSNTGIWDITITDVSPIVNTGIFTLVPNPVGITLTPGESREFTVTFEPTENIEYEEDVMFEFTYSDNNCVTTDIMNIRGEGGVTKKIQLRIPDLLTTPDLEGYSIPVYGRLINEGDSDNLEGFEIENLEIHFDRTLFYPVSVTKGEIIDNITAGVDDDRRIIRLRIPDISLTEDESVITEMVGYTMLGNAITTTIDIGSADFTQRDLVSEIFYRDGSGSLTIEICDEGGERLLNVLTPDVPLAASPNPASDNITISMYLIEQGIHRLQISDINGRTFEISRWTQNEAGSITLEYNSAHLSGGMYYLILNAPNRSYNLPVFILK